MTSANVTQAAGMFFGAAGVSAAKEASGALQNSFSQVLNQAAQPVAPQSANDRSKPSVTQTRVDNPVRKAADQISENVSAKNTDEKPSVKEETKDALEEAADEVKKKAAEVLGISLEDLEKAMEELGLSGLELLNPANVQELVMAVTGETDRLSLITNEELYTMVRELTQTVESLTAGLMEQLGVDEAQFARILEEASKLQKAEQETLSEEAGRQPASGEGDAEGGKIRDEEKVQAADENPAGVKEDGGKQTVKQDRTAEEGQPEDGKAAEKPAAEEASKGQNEAQTEGSTGETADNEKTLDARGRTSGHDSGQKGQGTESGNAFLEQFVRQNTDPVNTAQTDGAVPFEAADTRRIMDQIMEYMKTDVKPGITEMEMQLHPASLGTINIHLAAKDGVITAQFTAQNEAVRAALETQAVQLKDNLAEQGIKVETVEVTIASHEFERNLQEGNGGNSSQEEPRKKGVRKIRLTQDVSVEEMDLEEDEKIAAEMMEQNGNTVDFIA